MEVWGFRDLIDLRKMMNSYFYVCVSCYKCEFPCPKF